MSTKDHLSLHSWRLLPTHAWTPPSDGLHFIFLNRGAGQCAFDATHQPLAPGDVVLVQGGADCRLTPANGDELAFQSFSARLEHLFPLCRPAELRPVHSLMDRFNAPRFYFAPDPAAAHWHELVNNVPPQPGLEHRGRLLRVAAAVIHEEFKTLRSTPPPGQSVPHDPATDPEQLSVDEILSLPVSQLAARLHCCARQLNRLFHTHFGLPVGALRMEIRLLKALAFLRSRDFKLAHIAHLCGFNSLSRFGICFKRRFGLSPSQWRDAVLGPKTQPSTLANWDPNCQLRAQGLCPWSITRRKNNPLTGQGLASECGRSGETTISDVGGSADQSFLSALSGALFRA